MPLDNLRGSIVDLVRDMVVRQDIPPGRSVGEAALSRRFGVSRTPVREALLALEGEGLVVSRRGRGFEVSPLNPAEVGEIYLIIWTLERLALEIAGPPSGALVTELTRLNEGLDHALGAQQRVQLDTEWHALLVSECRNRHLLRTIRDLKHIVRRYEFAYLEDGQLKAKSTSEHKQIVSLLQTDPVEAQGLLERHWRDGMTEVISFLEGRKATHDQ